MRYHDRDEYVPDEREPPDESEPEDNIPDAVSDPIWPTADELDLALIRDHELNRNKWNSLYQATPEMRQRCQHRDEDDEQCGEYEHVARSTRDDGHRYFDTPTWTARISSEGMSSRLRDSTT